MTIEVMTDKEEVKRMEPEEISRKGVSDSTCMFTPYNYTKTLSNYSLHFSRLLHLLIRSEQHSKPVQAGDCHLLAVWDGKTERRRDKSSSDSCTGTKHLFPGRSATFTKHCQRQPHDLLVFNLLYDGILGLKRKWQHSCLIHVKRSVLYVKDCFLFKHNHFI